MKKKWLILGIMISITINLIFVGFVIGKYTSGQKALTPTKSLIGLPPYTNLHRDRMDGKLFMERRHKQAAMRTRLAGILAEIQPVQDSIEMAILARPYDQQALEQAFLDFRKLLGISQEQSHRLLVEDISSMTYDERAQFVEQAQRRTLPFRKRKHSERRRGPR